ncbi:hypothetical protein AHiyo8_15210 [Arthrobacter sp. Hiyo8]|nr:hypothetical protein AHiyo8_15210 [Arthrobacter sp. Hiyo8]
MEKDACRSKLSLAATVIAAGTRLGDSVHASVLELPAAKVTVMPLLIAPWTASSRLWFAGPERLRLATAGWPGWCCWTIQSRPAMTSEEYPVPSQPRTRTGTMVADLAMP